VALGSAFVFFGVVSFFGAGAGVAVFVVTVGAVVFGVTLDAFRTFGLCAPLHPAAAWRFVDRALSAAKSLFESVRCAKAMR
jgi:uncharacterized membrane protein YdcZ (DUF606 family)